MVKSLIGSCSRSRTGFATAFRVTLIWLCVASACTDNTGRAESSGADYRFSPLQMAVYGDSADLLLRINESKRVTAACMHARGWSSYVGIDTQIEMPKTQKQLDEYDAKFGYGVSTDPMTDQAIVEDANSPFWGGLSPLQRAKATDDLFGTASSDGCLREGYQAQFSVDFGSSQFRQATDEIEAKLNADPQLTELDSLWSVCMDARGYKYHDPPAILRYLTARFNKLGGASLASLQRDERSLYAADTACQTETGYRRKREQIAARVEAAVIEAHPALFLALPNVVRP